MFLADGNARIAEPARVLLDDGWGCYRSSCGPVLLASDVAEDFNHLLSGFSHGTGGGIDFFQRVL